MTTCNLTFAFSTTGLGHQRGPSARCGQPVGNCQSQRPLDQAGGLGQRARMMKQLELMEKIVDMMERMLQGPGMGRQIHGQGWQPQACDSSANQRWNFGWAAGCSHQPPTCAGPEKPPVRPITCAGPERPPVRPITCAGPEKPAVRPITCAGPERPPVQPITCAGPEKPPVQPVTCAGPETPETPPVLVVETGGPGDGGASASCGDGGACSI